MPSKKKKSTVDHNLTAQLFQVQSIESELSSRIVASSGDNTGSSSTKNSRGNSNTTVLTDPKKSAHNVDVSKIVLRKRSGDDEAKVLTQEEKDRIQLKQKQESQAKTAEYEEMKKKIFAESPNSSGGSAPAAVSSTAQPPQQRAKVIMIARRK